MLQNYFKIAWRNLLHNKSLFLINILGLAIGIASCLTIMLFVTDELSYDRFHKNSNEIFRVVFKAKIGGENINEAVVMAPVAQTLKDQFPEVVDATRFRNLGTQKVTYKNTSYRNAKAAYVEPNFFEIFSLPIIKGNANSPLDKPNSVVITQEEAQKYFGNEDPIGKLLEIEHLDQLYEVTGIIEKIPHNSHFHFDLLISMLGDPEAKNPSWMESRFFTYLLLNEGYNYKNLEAKFPVILETYVGAQLREAMGMTYAEFTKENKLGMSLQPLTDIHLKSDFSVASTLEEGGDIKSVYIFGAIALFMLLIACINFMNLSTAGATKRAKEVGIRKVLGSDRYQLIKQFLAESFITTLLSMIVGVVLLIIVLPVFNQLSGKELQIAYLWNPSVFLSLLILGLFVSVLAGAYPAFYISSFKPVQALKGKFYRSGKSVGIRSGLVVFQFVVSAGLILATLIVEQQMSFIQNKEIGYDKEQILVLREAYFLGENQAAFKNQILADPRVSHVTRAAFVPAGDSDNNNTGFYVDGQFSRRTYVYNIDDQYIPTMGMELAQGRNFSKDFGADSLKVIINETAAEILGFGDNAIGQTLVRAIDNEGGRQSLQVIGVVKDFHFRSLHKKIEPLIMLNNPYGGLIIRANDTDMAGIIDRIGKMWDDFEVSEPFSYALLDESFHATYLKERRTSTLVKVFALLTIFVACLGLFGLATFTAEQRLKEIGIRKVLGSSVTQIVAMLSKDFLKLVSISFFIAFPLGYYFMNIWLQDFAYRIEIGGLVFVITGLITLAIAFITISFRSFKAARANPIESLKTE